MKEEKGKKRKRRIDGWMDGRKERRQEEAGRKEGYQCG
jgi:hypothetical protein